MKNDIQWEVQRSPHTYYVPVAVYDHVFSLTPGSFIDDWTAGQAPGEWTEDKLKAPARAHVQALRTEPPLGEMLSHVAGLIDRHKDGYGIPQLSRAELAKMVESMSGPAGNDDGAYTLQGVYEALITPGVYLAAADMQSFCDCVATAILQVEPPRTIQIADTHMESPTRWGSTDRLGVLYNPFRDTVNIHCMDDLHDGHAPARKEWLANPWHIMTTPLHDTDETQALVQG